MLGFVILSLKKLVVKLNVMDFSFFAISIDQVKIFPYDKRLIEMFQKLIDIIIN